MKLSNLLTAFCLILVSSCAGMEVADIRPMITLPASKDCYGVTVVSVQKIRIPKAECDEIKKRAIFMTSEDWKKQKVSILKSCQLTKCKQFVGVFDDLFKAVDNALQKVP